MENNDSVGISNSIKSDLKDLSSDIVEVGFDKLLSDGILKDIPMIGSFFKVLGIAKKVLDANFLNNILKFLYQLKEIPKSKRIEFIEKMEDDNQKKKLDQTLLVYLNRFESDRKATILGNLFKSFIIGHFDQSTFFRLSMSVDKAFIDDLIVFKESKSSNQVSDELKRQLCDVGFFIEKIRSVTTDQHYMGKQAGDPPLTVSVSEFHETNYGKLFKEYG